MEGGLNGQVVALSTAPNGDVYVGGDFTTAGGKAANRVAKWNAFGWSALGTGVDDLVIALAVGNGGQVYVGGAFSHAGGAAIPGLAMWNGGGWSALGNGGTNQQTFALCVDGGGNLYASGWGQAGDGVFKWNGASWSVPGAGLIGQAEVLCADVAGNVYAAGDITGSGNKFIANVAKAVAASEIEITRSTGGAVAQGSVVNLGIFEVGGTASLELVIRNKGSAALTGITTTIVDAGASGFSVGTQPSGSVEAGADTKFTVTFSPVSGGFKAAVLRVDSNDPDESPYYIQLWATATLRLASLAVSEGQLSPAFSPAVTRYDMTVLNAVSSLKVKPSSKGTATIKVNNVPVVSGSWSGTLALKEGSNVIRISLLAQDGKTSETYIINVTRNSSTANTLSMLILRDETMYPGFDPSKLAYKASVPPKQKSIMVTATTTSDVARIKINGVIVKSGVESKAIALASGENLIEVVVTAGNGKKKTYVITVTRRKAANLRSLTKGEFFTMGRPAGRMDFSDEILGSTRLERSGGMNYLAIRIAKPLPEGFKASRVEVSSDLVNWYSGWRFTKIVEDNESYLVVRDTTPVGMPGKRYIRVKPAR